MSTITIRIGRIGPPGVWADLTLGRVGPHLPDYYGKVVGKTIEKVVLENFEGQPLPVLYFTDGSTATVMCDPEGNGPGHLDITPP